MYGQLGVYSTMDHAAPERLSSAHVFTQISAGGEHTCAVQPGGTAMCWWVEACCAMSIRLPCQAVLFAFCRHQQGLRTLLQAAWLRGRYHHILLCRGQGSSGQLGIGALGGNATANTTSPTFRTSPAALDPQLKLKQISAGYIFTCGLSLDGQAFCWGSEWIGSRLPLGVAQGVPRAVLQARSCFIPRPKGRPSYFSAGNNYGQLGVGSTTSAWEPLVVDTPLRFVQLSAGAYHACALTADGAAWCWGEMRLLGDGLGCLQALAAPRRYWLGGWGWKVQLPAHTFIPAVS